MVRYHQLSCDDFLAAPLSWRSFFLHISRPAHIEGTSSQLVTMDRIRRLLAEPTVYEPLEESAEDGVSETEHDQQRSWGPFSRLEYGIFMLLGVAMLWAW